MGRFSGSPALAKKDSTPLTRKAAEIEDQVAGRVIVFYLDDIAGVLDTLKGTFNAVERSRRHPQRDEEFGYESEHLIAALPPQVLPDEWQGRDDLPTTFELQVRTVFMHAYAEPQHDLGYKAPSAAVRDPPPARLDCRLRLGRRSSVRPDRTLGGEEGREQAG
jgi:GTP pyrophosphokinase